MTETVLDSVLARLVDEGVARDPRDDSARPLPPCWRFPVPGAPAPGEKRGSELDDGVTVSLFIAPGIAPPSCEQWIYRIDGVDMWVRCKKPPDGIAFEERARAVLADRFDETWGDETIIHSRLFRDFALLGSDQQGFTFLCGYLIQRYPPVPAAAGAGV